MTSVQLSLEVEVTDSGLLPSFPHSLHEHQPSSSPLFSPEKQSGKYLASEHIVPLQ